MAAGLAFFGGILNVGAFGISPDPAIFNSSTTTFSYYTNAGEYGVQFRNSGNPQQRIGLLLATDSQNGTLLSQSGGEPVATLDIVFLNSQTASDYCVSTTYADCINTQSPFVIGQKQIVWNSTPVTPATTSTTTLQFDYTDFFNVFLLFGLFVYFLLIVYIVKKQLIKFL